MIYLDNAATTKIRPEVLKEMLPFLKEKYGNASSLHSLGSEAKNALEKSREKTAKLLKVKPKEIIFTGSATEANNFALKGLAFKEKQKGRNHLIISEIEHHCVLHSAEWLEKNGFKVTRVPVDENGLVKVEEIEKAITPKTFLVSVMHSNNEIGSIQPVEEISTLCREKGVFFHSDAVQSLGKTKIKTKNTDLLGFSAHKIYGPKGVGLLMKKSNVQTEPLIHGGGHENSLRSGTENIAGIVGFAKAIQLALKEMPKESKRQAKLRDQLIKDALEIPESRLNGHAKKRLCNNANLSFKFVEGESIVMKLNEKAISASTGSACSSPNLEPSHVLLAIGLSPSEAHGSLRISLGKFNSKQEIKVLREELPKAIKELRELSPFWRK